MGDDITRLVELSEIEATRVSGTIGPCAWAQITAGVELGRRIEATKKNREVSPAIRSTAATVGYCRQRFSRLAMGGKQEEFHVVMLDTKNQVIACHRVTVGTLDASLVHPREMFRVAIRDAAAAVLLVNNHTSGNPSPSPEDRAVTERLEPAGQTLDIDVLDHVVVASGGCVSLRAMG